MQPVSSVGLLRGAQAITDHLNSRLAGGKPLSRAAIYRMIEDGKIPVTRLGAGKGELWAKVDDLDRLFNLADAA